MNPEKSKTPDPHTLLLNRLDKINLEGSNKYIALSNLVLYMEKYKKFIKNNKFQISAPTRNEKFELSDGSYSVSDIEDYVENNKIFKKHETVYDNPSILIYVNKIENRTTLKIKTGYYLELLTPEIMKLLRSTKSKITKNKNGQNVPHIFKNF